ncbi:transglycosylase [Bacillus sp. AM 13(2015)]|nr:transglycosylase [Bacillus sp. AM 13(2015)]
MGMDNQTCVCDQCGTSLLIQGNSKIEKLGDVVKRHYIKCPRCLTEYTSYFTNEVIRRKQSRIRKLFVVLRSARSEKLLEMYKKKIKEAQMDCQKDMDQLRREMEAPLP